jgi:hypothetical protein
VRIDTPNHISRRGRIDANLPVLQVIALAYAWLADEDELMCRNIRVIRIRSVVYLSIA